MIAKEIISTDILPLRPEDNCAQAVTMMSVYRVSNLPVVVENELLGVLTEEDVSSQDSDKLISDFTLAQSHIFVSDQEHIFDILAKLTMNKLSVIPVLDKDEKYVGMITQESLLNYYASTFAFKEPGSILVIRTTKADYSLSEMTRVIEMEGALVLSSFVTSSYDSSNLLVTLKLNQMEIGKVVTALERYDYDIHAAFTEDSYQSDLKSRYDLLMRYLNV